MNNGTIAAVATPAGEGSIGVIRISGEKAVEIADACFASTSGRKISSLGGYSALFGNIVDNGNVIDEAVALYFKAPKSYTGEDVVEISVHGGQYVVLKILRLILDNGARPAERGEFTRRAFQNGKMDLSQAEAVMDIISADGEQALRASIEAHGGAVSKRCNEIKEKLTFAAACVAAFSDYPDEEPEFSGIDRLESMLDSAADELSALIENYDVGKRIRHGINTVIVGSPNVGKSTLMNLLSGYDRSIVTSVAGTTRDIVEETVNLDGIILRLSDTAGLRDTTDTVEKIGVEKTHEKIKSADLIIMVVDSSCGLTDDDLSLLESIKERNVVVVFNKSDIKEPDFKRVDNLGLAVVAMSAKNGQGYDGFANAVKMVTKTANVTGSSAVYLNERQRSCAVQALNCVNEARSTLQAGFTIDAVGVCLDDALSALMELTGERVTVEVANKVFEHFCVGK